MQIKGTAFLARRALLSMEVGETRAAELIEAYLREHPDFPRMVLATTSIPAELFIDFNEMLVRELYAGDAQGYWTIGEKSAEWALTAGPYKHLRATKSLAQFAETGRLLYQNYYSEGRAETSIQDKVVDLKLIGVPPKYRHLYMEYAIVGYFKRGLELVGARSVTAERLRGFSKNDPDVHYRYTLA
jgi:hypothetical protein